jgi:PPOX class probable F420-dependent enzyme
MEPTPQRPHMPGYGVRAADEGNGLLAWADVEARLGAAHDYWLATVWPDGRPHLMPVWAVWDGTRLWFSTGGQSRKLANLVRDPRCVLSIDDAANPIVVEGVARVERDRARIEEFRRSLNAKYGTDYQADFFDPNVNATIAVTAQGAFALLSDDFTGSPTRWTFRDDIRLG